MKIILMILAGLAGCATELPTSSTADELTKGELEVDGFTCTKTLLGFSIECTRCGTVTIDDPGGTSHTVKVCSEYNCDSAGNNCMYGGAYQGATTFDDDLDYGFEAESMTSSTATRITDYAASGGAAVAGSGSIAFTAPVAGTLIGWVRVLALSGGSLTVSLDGKSAGLVLPARSTYAWVAVPSTTWSVATGSHTLRFDGPANVRIDRLLFTASADFVPVAQTIEAETAELVAPMQVGSVGSLFDRTGFVSVPNGAGAGGLAQLDLALPRAGHYAIWGRTNAATSADNAFDVAADLGATSRWNLPVSGTAWAWSKAPLLFLDTDSFVRVSRVDDGARLDKVIVTNDPGFVPVEPPPLTNAP